MCLELSKERTAPPKKPATTQANRNHPAPRQKLTGERWARPRSLEVEINDLKLPLTLGTL